MGTLDRDGDTAARVSCILYFVIGLIRLAGPCL